MVKLTVTAAAKAALEEYRARKRGGNDTLDGDDEARLQEVSTIDLGSPIEHHDLIEVSKYLVQSSQDHDVVAKQWRLDTLLKGAMVYQAPPPPKPEPVGPHPCTSHPIN